MLEGREQHNVLIAIAVSAVGGGVKCR